MHDLREGTHHFEEAMQLKEEEIQSHEQDIGQLRGQMRRLDSTDSLYVSLIRYRLTLCKFEPVKTHSV